MSNKMSKLLFRRKFRKTLKTPNQDLETGEWRYKGKWYDSYPSEELEKDEAAYDDYCDREFRRKKEEG